MDVQHLMNQTVLCNTVALCVPVCYLGCLECGAFFINQIPGGSRSSDGSSITTTTSSSGSVLEVSGLTASSQGTDVQCEFH